MKRVLSIILIILILSITLISCSRPVQNKITVEISKESRDLRDELFLENDIIGMGKEEQIYNYNKNYRDYITNRKKQAFPDVTTNNELTKENSDLGDIYSLSKDNTSCVVLYIHGGFVWEVTEDQIKYCDNLVDELNATVYIPIYPLAPQSLYTESYDMILSVYDKLLELDKPIYIVGDSTGGTITLGTIFKLKEEGKELPEKIILISPVLDMSFSNPEIDTYQSRDGILAKYILLIYAKLWASGAASSDEEFNNIIGDKLLSPINGDFEDFPDTLIFIGTNEILYPDTILLYNKMCDEKNNCTLVEGKGLWHNYPLYDIKEKDDCLNILKEFLLEIDE